ncbi:MAG: vitamin K epoxide reductase family protein [Chthoniobacterales bacterium]
MAKKRRKPQPTAPATGGKLPVILYSLAAVLTLVGLADATYLTASHFSGETVTCVGTIGCSDVLASAYARIGKVPLAAFGVLAYFTAFSAAVLAAFRFPRARGVLMIAVGAMFLTSLWLLYVQAFVLHAFCSYCLLSAALTFALAGIVIVAPPIARET